MVKHPWINSLLILAIPLASLASGPQWNTHDQLVIPNDPAIVQYESEWLHALERSANTLHQKLGNRFYASMTVALSTAPVAHQTPSSYLNNSLYIFHQKISEALVQDHQFDVVSRSKLASFVLDEINLQYKDKGDLMNLRPRSQLRELIGADHILFIRGNKLLSSIIFHADLIEVETGVLKFTTIINLREEFDSLAFAYDALNRAWTRHDNAHTAAHMTDLEGWGALTTKAAESEELIGTTPETPPKTKKEPPAITALEKDEPSGFHFGEYVTQFTPHLQVSPKTAGLSCLFFGGILVEISRFMAPTLWRGFTRLGGLGIMFTPAYFFPNMKDNVLFEFGGAPKKKPDLIGVDNLNEQYAFVIAEQVLAKQDPYNPLLQGRVAAARQTYLESIHEHIDQMNYTSKQDVLKQVDADLSEVEDEMDEVAFAIAELSEENLLAYSENEIILDRLIDEGGVADYIDNQIMLAIEALENDNAL